MIHSHMPFNSEPLLKDARNIALVGNGAIHDYHLIKVLIQHYDRHIAVDGGLFHFMQMDLIPDLIVGDLDSVSSTILNAYQDVPKQVFPQDKNETDMELAATIANLPSVEKIAIFGGMEKRTDHALFNLHLMSRFKGKMIIETESEMIFLIEGKQKILTTPGQTLSLIPIGVYPTGVTTKGLKWELENASFNEYFMSLSNICLRNEVEVEIKIGRVVCCLTRLEPVFKMTSIS